MELSMDTELTKLLGMPKGTRKEKGVEYTASEINSQVGLWHDTYERFKKSHADIKSFMKESIEQNNPSIILTGAGTSEFIGYCVEGLFRKRLNLPVNTFSTTKIVANPEEVMVKNPRLLISFARSGNSPESLGAVHIAEGSYTSHFIVTCNHKGALSQISGKLKKSFLLCLDQAANDRGLAMTASFSNMVIAAQLLADFQNFDDAGMRVDRLVSIGQKMLSHADIFHEASRLDFKRAVFLGDGSHFGTAVESHLKLQELTSGRVMCAYDTFLGLRHGPEAVIDEETLVVAFVSGNRYVQKYEEDLLCEIHEKKLGRAVLVVCRKKNDMIDRVSDLIVECDPEGDEQPADDYMPPVYVIAGQLLGLFKSIALGFKPDSPSESGIIHRVVEGVKIYDFATWRKTGNFKIISER